MIGPENYITAGSERGKDDMGLASHMGVTYNNGSEEREDMQTSAQAVSIEQFVAGLRKLQEPAFTGVDGVLEYLRATPVDPQSLASFLTWDAQHYTRNLVDHTELYDLIAICWEVGQHSSIHNHKGQNCWMTVPIGRLMVQNFRVLEEDLSAQHCNLEATNQLELNPQNPTAVNPQEPVHSVYNSREFAERAVSLHVYSRPFDSCVVYSMEQRSCGEIKLHFNTEYGVPVKD